MQQKDTFKTIDYALAAWLCYRSQTLLGAVKLGDNPHLRFVFMNSEGLQEAMDEWNEASSEEVRICKKFFRKINVVKHSLKEPQVVDV